MTVQASTKQFGYDVFDPDGNYHTTIPIGEINHTSHDDDGDHSEWDYDGALKIANTLDEALVNKWPEVKEKRLEEQALIKSIPSPKKANK